MIVCEILKCTFLWGNSFYFFLLFLFTFGFVLFGGNFFTVSEDNPIVANGGSHGSNSSLDKVEGGATVAGKKIDDEDEDEQSGTGTSDQDTFMFGMSKLRTFFFFLSLALLVAFVLVFVFVLPCSQTAQMDERTNKVTDHGRCTTCDYVDFSVKTATIQVVSYVM